VDLIARRELDRLEELVRDMKSAVVGTKRKAAVVG
jgi:hypothetical protein